MPPRPKNSKEEIARAAFEIVKEQGIDALSARELGRKLNCSAGSIFTVLPNMEAVRDAARELALAEFKESISDFRNYTPPFKRIGMVIVSYGMEKPELFKLLFMKQHEMVSSFEEALHEHEEIYRISLKTIMEDYSLTEEDAKLVFEQMWVLATGLGMMCAMKICSFTEADLNRRLSVSFMSLFLFMKAGKMKTLREAVRITGDGEFNGQKVHEIFQVLLEDTEGEEK